LMPYRALQIGGREFEIEVDVDEGTR
jgi:hypothetical protein